MQFSAIPSFQKRKAADAILVPCWQGKDHGEVAEPHAQELVGSTLSLGDFKGKEGETLLVYVSGAKEPRAVLVGLGKRGDISKDTLRLSYGAAVRDSRLKVKTVNVLLPEVSQKLLSESEVITSAAEGMLLANETFDELKHDLVKEEPTVLIEKAAFVAGSKLLEGPQRMAEIMSGVKLARNLVNRNARDVTPSQLANEAKMLSRKFKTVSTTVFDRKRIKKEGMGLFLAVNQGSSEEPAFIIVEYKGKPSSKERSVIVGKGITFDTGGLNLKPGSGMETMKCDMAGGAAVLGTIYALASIGLKENVTAVIASTDNAIGSRAYKPGDVYQGYSGKTVEIGDTDAEGRLTLADALAYAVKNLKPKRIIDLATLTGSVVIALGEHVAGLMSNSDELATALHEAGQETGEWVWRMPMPKLYRKLLKSDIADIKSIGGRPGGAITAALFLKEFVGDTPWAHLDIAGTAYPNKASTLSPSRATGYGVRLLTELFTRLSHSKS